MATRAEVLQQIGEDLGLVPIGQSLESQDENRIGVAYDQAYERVKEKGLASWAAAGDVPNQIVPYFCLLIEEKLLISYSVPESRYLRIQTAAGEDGMNALQKIAALAIEEYESTENNQDF